VGAVTKGVADTAYRDLRLLFDGNKAIATIQVKLYKEEASLNRQSFLQQY